MCFVHLYFDTYDFVFVYICTLRDTYTHLYWPRDLNVRVCYKVTETATTVVHDNNYERMDVTTFILLIYWMFYKTFDKKSYKE